MIALPFKCSVPLSLKVVQQHSPRLTEPRIQRKMLPRAQLARPSTSSQSPAGIPCFTFPAPHLHPQSGSGSFSPLCSLLLRSLPQFQVRTAALCSRPPSARAPPRQCQARRTGRYWGSWGCRIHCPHHIPFLLLCSHLLLPFYFPISTCFHPTQPQ